MCDFSELEPLVVTSHEKGINRGISIYFGVNQIKKLEEQGIDFRNNRRFLVRTTIDNKVVLIPFSEIDFLLDIEDQLDRILELNKEEMESFGEDLLVLITKNKVELSDQERYSVFQFTKSHYTRYNIRNAIRIGLRADKSATQDLLKEYIEKMEE
ncbi:MAG: hypothetical protein HWN67_09880 [Candidatus Helarchaeota archaeon]|nr:hypothetical protein [Candidatus Helarchaeota archaeon]